MNCCCIFTLMATLSLSIIIPTYNEGHTIRAVLEKVINASLPQGVTTEIIIIDDASTDRTRDEINKFTESHPGKRIIYKRHDVNVGKGAAIHTGIEAASGDFLLIQDADLEYDPADYSSLLQPVIENRADIVYGTRFMGGKPHRILFFWHTIGNKFLTFLSNMLSNLNLTDMENGFKLFRRSVINSLILEEKRFGFEPEVTAKAARIPGIRFYEVGIAYYGRTYEEGKKISWRDGMKAIYCILKYNLFDRQLIGERKTKTVFAWLPVLLFLVAGLLLAFTASGTADEGDSIMHYLFARHAFEYPSHFFYHWAKPLYVLITAPVTQAGFTGIKLFNLLISTVTLWLTYRTALKLHIPNAWVAPVMAVFAPALMIVTLSGLTEPLFACWMMAGILLLCNGKIYTGVTWLSFIPFIRSEGLILLCVLLLFLFVKKYYKAIPLLFVGHVVYALAGYAFHKDFLWVFNTMSYATFSSAYGNGEWLHFARNLPEVIGIPLCILLVAGILYGMFQLTGKYLFRDRTVSEEKLFLIYGMFAAYFIGHTIFWALGIFNSFGLLRVLVGVIPLIAIICLEGLNALTRLGKSRVIFSIALIAIIIYPFINAKYSYKWKRDFSLKADQEAELKLASYVKENFPGYKKHVFYYEPAYLSVALDINYFDTGRHKRLLNAFQANNFPDSSFLIWDDWFAPMEGKVDLEQVVKDGRFKELASFEEKDFWGVTRVVKLFVKK
jgi:glycosyltransferase involved in cell wall biosynthesis